MDQVLADTLTANLKAAKTTEAQTGALTPAMIAERLEASRTNTVTVVCGGAQ